MLVAHLVAAVERLAPVALAAEWDNVGLIVGRHNRSVRQVLVALELRDEVLAEAREFGCEALVTHHPPIFPSLATVSDDTLASDLVLAAAESRLAVITAHTNLDAAEGGLNELMASALGMRDGVPLEPAAVDQRRGLGRVGEVPTTTLERFVGQVSHAFGGCPAGYAGDGGTRVSRVACCTGSGASLIGAARAAEADVMVTSDLKYHDADRAEGLPLVGIPHARVERELMRRWCRRLEREISAEGAEVRFAESDTDPWHVLSGGH